jgi:hypothetical protein
MPLFKGQTPVAAYRGINAYRFAVLEAAVAEAEQDATLIACLAPDCDGFSVDEKFKAEVVKLALAAVNAGIDLASLPDFCNCEEFVCDCAGELTVTAFTPPIE